MRALGGGDLLALVGLDLGQDVGQDRPLKSIVGDRDQALKTCGRGAAVE